MVETAIIMAIGLALAISIGVTAAAQKRERALQQQRLKVSKLRHKSNQVQDLLEWMNANVGEPATCGILCDMIIGYMNQILEIDPSLRSIDQNIQYHQELSGNPPPKQAISVPNNNVELNNFVGKVNRIMTLVSQLAQTGVIPAMRANKSLTALKQTYFQVLVDGHIGLGKSAHTKGEVGTAVQHFSFAQEKLNSSPLGKEVIAEKSAVIADYIAQMTTKKQDEAKAKAAAEAAQKEAEAKVAEAEAGKDDKAGAAKLSEKGDTTGLGNKDNLFSDKKKW